MSLPCEDRAGGQLLWGGKRALPGDWIGQHLRLESLVSGIVRNKCLLFRPPNLWCFAMAAEQTGTVAHQEGSHSERTEQGSTREPPCRPPWLVISCLAMRVCHWKGERVSAPALLGPHVFAYLVLKSSSYFTDIAITVFLFLFFTAVYTTYWKWALWLWMFN